MKRRTRTITETHEVWVVRRVSEGVGRAPQTCAACGATVGMVAPEEAAALSGLSTRAVYALVEAGGLHFEERPCGEIFVCLDSLTNLAGAGRVRRFEK